MTSRFIFFTIALGLVCSSLVAQTPHPMLKPSLPIPSAITHPQPPVVTPTEKDNAWYYADLIKVPRLKAHVDTLAGKYFIGRETGQPGQYRAARYIADQYYEWGLQPLGTDTSFFQYVPLIEERWKELTLSVDGDDAVRYQDFYAVLPVNTGFTRSTFSDLVFLGYGIDDPKYSDYKKYKKKLADKVVVIFAGEPMDTKGNYRITGTDKPSIWTNDWTQKVLEAKRRGIKALLIIDPTVDFAAPYLHRLKLPYFHREKDEIAPRYVNCCYITPEFAARMFDSDWEKIKKYHKAMDDKGVSKWLRHSAYVDLTMMKARWNVKSYNPVAYIEGTSLKNEVVVITAAHDGIGWLSETAYSPSANQNASGVAAMLEIANAFRQAKADGRGPKRSIMFVSPCGQFQNQAGMKTFYEHALPGGGRPIAVVDISSIGRQDTLRLKVAQNYVYTVGDSRSGANIQRIIEDINQKYTHIAIDQAYDKLPAPNPYLVDSPLEPYVEKGGIQAIRIIGGHTADDNTLNDTADKVNPWQMETAARVSFFTVWRLAND